jgi:hypothetical protein
MNEGEHWIVLVAPFVNCDTNSVGIDSVVTMWCNGTWKNSVGFHLREARAQET